MRREEREAGIQKGIRQGAEQKEITNIRSLMRKMNVDARQAMDLLSVPPEQRDRYASMLQ